MKHYSPSRAPSWPTELSSRPRVQDSEGPLRLEVEAISIPLNPGNNGPSGSGPVCITPDEAASLLLQLETRSRSRGNRYLYAELGNLSGICQSSMVSDTLLPDQGEKTGSKDSANNTIVENPVMLVLDLLEDHPCRIPQHPDSISMTLGQEFLMQEGIPQLVVWPISGNPSHHEAFLQRLQTSWLHHGKTKPMPTMDAPFLNGLAGVNRGVEIPLWDLQKMWLTF